VAGIVSFFDEEKEVEDEGVRSFMQRAKALKGLGVALGACARPMAAIFDCNGQHVQYKG
jgi:hypothetical protein